MKKRIGIAVLGLGWMGQAHSRAALRIASLFPDAKFKPELVVCADVEQSRRDRAVNDFGFARAVPGFEEAVSAKDVDAVWVTAPNMLHVPMISAAAAAGQSNFQREANWWHTCANRRGVQDCNQTFDRNWCGLQLFVVATRDSCA